MATKLSPSTSRAVRKYGPRVNRLARRKYGIGGKKLLSKLVVGESGDRMDAVSSAGARGKGQFMPGTRAAMLKQYGLDPWRSTDEAVYGAVIHLKGKLGHRKGLEGYNPGDPNYPAYILSQKVRVPKGGAPPTMESSGPLRTPTQRSSSAFTPTKTDIDAVLLDTLAEGRARHGSLFDSITQKLDSGAYTTTVSTAQATKTQGRRTSATVTRSQRGREPQQGGSYTVSANANRPGTKLKPYVSEFLSGLAGRAGEFEVGTGTNHSRLTVNGNVSDHWDGSGADIPATGRRLMELMEAALLELGVSSKTAKRWAKNGGLYNVTRGGVRYQIIGRTNEGGNHHNHLHVGIRPQ